MASSHGSGVPIPVHCDMINFIGLLKSTQVVTGCVLLKILEKLLDL